VKVEDHDVAGWGIEVSEKTELITLGLGPQARLNGSGRARSGKFTSQEGDHARPRTGPRSRVRGTASSKAVVSTGEWMPSLGHDGDAGISQDFTAKPTSPYSGSGAAPGSVCSSTSAGSKIACSGREEGLY
jgi:hypothetical protein